MAEICWCNSETYTIGDHINVYGKIGIVIETIHQYIKTDIPELGWINVLTETTIRGIPMTCNRCIHSCGYSGGPYYCDETEEDNLDKDHTCDKWSYFRGENPAIFR